MADDIVERLRRHDHDWLPDTHALCDYCDALYEIERLREAGNKMVKALVDIGGLLPDEYNLIETWKRLTVAYPKVD